MPLGLAKDSMLSLAELASSKIEEEQTENDNNEEQQTKTEADSSFTDVTGSELGSPASKSSSLDDFVSQTNSTEKPRTQQYAGFSADYHEFENYAYHSSSNFDRESTISKPIKVDGQRNIKQPSWQCIFPWCPPKRDSEKDVIDDEFDTLADEKQKTNGEEKSTTVEAVDDEISIISAESDIRGVDMSQKDKKAMSAGSSQPDTTKTQAENSDDSKEGKRGILKRSSTRNHDFLSQSTRSNLSNGSRISRTGQRRSLFPSYEQKTVVKKDLNVTFSPMARVVTIKSLNDMDFEEKSSIWWQKADYDEFRKTGRMVSKVMLQGGSEIWLATNQSWQLPNQGKAVSTTLRHAINNIDNEDTSDKWWHKFGHSRRGLEHIASIDEGKQRQSNVKTSIVAVVTEQRRQKVFRREDPDKLRMVYIQNTSWAKDLALASGASDADAVTKNFDEDSRRSREFYLLKFSRASQMSDHSTLSSADKQVVPAFMKPTVSLQLRPNRLDANTTSRIKFRQKEEKAVNHQLHQSIEPIHNLKFDGRVRESLARKAAGFANGEESVNMSAVMAGMVHS